MTGEKVEFITAEPVKPAPEVKAEVKKDGKQPADEAGYKPFRWL